MKKILKRLLQQGFEYNNIIKYLKEKKIFMISTDSILSFLNYASSLKLFGISLLDFFAFVLTFFLILLTKNIQKKFIITKINLFY